LSAMNVKDAGETAEKVFQQEVAKKMQSDLPSPEVSFEELKDRLSQIDWLRYRKHWIVITGANMKAGKKKTFKLKSTGEEKVVAQAQNTATVIAAVTDKILSPTWADLTAHIDEPLSPPDKENKK